METWVFLLIVAAIMVAVAMDSHHAHNTVTVRQELILLLALKTGQTKDLFRVESGVTKKRKADCAWTAAGVHPALDAGQGRRKDGEAWIPHQVRNGGVKRTGSL